MEKSTKYCTVSSSVYKILGILGLVPLVLCILVIVYLTVIDIINSIAGSKTPMDAFAGTLIHAIVTILSTVGIVLLIISLINLALAITGTIAVKRNSIRGLKINGTVKLVVEFIEILFSIILLKSIGFSNIENILYIVLALINIAINAVLAGISYIQISSLK